jgi:hypothetical protein
VPFDKLRACPSTSSGLARKPECVTPMDLFARLSEGVADEDAA